jgi:hypothetical protein
MEIYPFGSNHSLPVFQQDYFNGRTYAKTLCFVPLRPSGQFKISKSARMNQTKLNPETKWRRLQCF